MSRRHTRVGARWAALALAGITLALLTAGGCAGNNRRVSVGGSIHMGSGGSWGHSLSVGIHSHGRRR